MLRLTREVRFAVNASAGARTGANGYGGVPAIEGLGRWFSLRITLGGPVSEPSGYLRNIVEIDQKVRELGVPVVEQALRGGETHGQVLENL